MNSKQRVLTTFASKVPDRVPVNYFSNPGIDARLKQFYGLKPNDVEGLRIALGVDFRGINAPYRGAKLYEDIPARGVKVDNWGIHRRWVEHTTGGYWDFCDFPLKDADEHTIAEWRMPSPDDFDYSKIEENAKQRYGQYAVFTGSAGFGDIINANGMIRGTEQTLVDLITNDPAGLLLAQRRVDVQLEIIRRTLVAANGGIDFLWIGEDLGSQNAQIISRELYLKHIRPLHKKFVDLANTFGIPVMIHSCGSSSWAYNDFIEIGIKVVDTLQPEAKDMAPEYLKKSFGGKLAFHGCISTAGPVATGTVDEVVRYCRKTLEVMMPGGGYCFAPTHQLQDNSPTENVVAMYDTAKKYGGY
ncbi:MAG: uroporphyrinogen decarboxylase family protein [Elusimicrobiota bacterium]